MLNVLHFLPTRSRRAGGEFSTSTVLEVGKQKHLATCLTRITYDTSTVNVAIPYMYILDHPESLRQRIVVWMIHVRIFLLSWNKV